MRNQRWTAVVLTVLVVACPMTIRAATIELSVPGTEGAEGESVAIPLMVRGADKIGALQADVVFDAAVLALDDVEPSEEFAGLLDFHVGQPGRLRIALATTEPMEEDGPLLTMRFSVLGGTKSTIAIEDAKAWDEENSHQMLVAAQPGQFTVAESQAAASQQSPPDDDAERDDPDNTFLIVAIAVGGVLAVLLLLNLLRRSGSSG